MSHKQNSYIVYKQYLKLCIVILFISSCIPQNKLQYVQDKAKDSLVYNIHRPEIHKIKPYDELYIRVSSFDEVNYNFFNNQSDLMRMNYGNELSVSLVSYTVNDSGYIYFPILGNVYVKDHTLLEATNKLRESLSEYFNQPTVIIKLVNKRITILGEVNSPGTYTFTKDEINIFEAIGLAGDITLHGDKHKVIILRNNENKLNKNYVDLTKNNILEDPAFFLQSGDIIYVSNRNSLKWGPMSTPITLILSLVTTLLLLYNYIR